MLWNYELNIVLFDFYKKSIEQSVSYSLGVKKSTRNFSKRSNEYVINLKTAALFVLVFNK